MSGNIVSDFNTLSIEVSCEGAPVPTAACAQWQQGIGNPNGDGVTQGVVGLAQDAIFRRFYSVDWTAPVTFPPCCGLLPGIVIFPPVMHEGPTALNPSNTAPKPCTTAGNTFNNGAAYNC